MLNVVIFGLVGFVVVSAAIVSLSVLIEEMRSVPPTPERLSWAPDIPIKYVSVNVVRLRYIKTGEGPVLVLLHTLRTQLDLFEKVVPDLAKSFTVYAVDYRATAIPTYRPRNTTWPISLTRSKTFSKRWIFMMSRSRAFSIGGSISLIAARDNLRVSRVVAINPYDYAKGRGMARSSFFGRLIVAVADLKVLGDTVMRLRQFFIMKSVLDGGVADPKRIPPELLKEMYLVGNRKGHYRAFLNLLRNAETWETATKDYSNITIPVLLLWGHGDWSRPDEREHDHQIVPGAKMVTVADGGHFLPLDRPDAAIEHLRAFQAPLVPKAAS